MPRTVIKPPLRLLLIPPRFIGDVVVATALLKAIKQAFPDCQCHVMLPEGLHNLLAQSPFVDELIPTQKDFRRTVHQVRQRNYDVAILLRRSLTEALMLKLAGVSRIIGFKEQRLFSPAQFLTLGLFLDAALPYPPLKATEPHLKLLSKVLTPLGLPENNGEFLPEIHLDSDDLALGKLLVKKHGFAASKLAVIQTQTASKEKELLPVQFVPSLQLLHQAGYQLLSVGSAQEEKAVNALAELANVPILNLCGQTTLRQSAAIISHASLFFGLDSGPAHIAAAMGVPSMAVVYGPINDFQWRPWPYEGSFTAIKNMALDCRPCLPKVCEHNACRTQLTGAMIAQQLQVHLEPLAAYESTHAAQ